MSSSGQSSRAAPAITRFSSFMYRKLRTTAQTISFKQLSPRRGISKKSSGGTIVVSVPLEEQLPVGSPEPTGGSTPSAASCSTDTTAAPTPRPRSRPRLATGAHIYLNKADCVVTVVGLDVVGQRYLLRNEDTTYEWYETLTGPGCVKWELVAEQELDGFLKRCGQMGATPASLPAPPTAEPQQEAPVERKMTRKGCRLARRDEELAAEAHQCPICCYDLDECGEWGARLHT